MRFGLRSSGGAVRNIRGARDAYWLIQTSFPQLMAPRRAFTKRRSHKRAAAATEPHVSYHRPSCVNRQHRIPPHKLPPHSLTTGAYTHTERLSQFSLGRASTPPCDSHAPIRRRRCTAPAPITRSYPLLSLSYTHPAVRTKIIVHSKQLNSAGRPTGSGRARTPTSPGRGACSSRRP